MDSMKLASAAFSAYARLEDRRTAWGDAALEALLRTEQSGALSAEVPGFVPDAVLQRHLSGPPAARRDGPWTPAELDLIALLRLGLSEARRLNDAGEGRAAAQVGALMAPLPAVLRGGQRRPFDPRLFRQQLRQAVLPWHLLSEAFRALLTANAEVRAPLPDRLR